MYRLLAGGLMACVISGVAFAQAPPAPAMPKQYQDVAAAMAAAQARAVRPGDDALGCAAIEKELAQLESELERSTANPQTAAATAAALSSNAALAAQGKPTP